MNINKSLQGLIGKTVKSAFEESNQTTILFEDGTGVKMYVFSTSAFGGLFPSAFTEVKPTISVVMMTSDEVKNFINSRRAKIEATLAELRSLPNLDL